MQVYIKKVPKKTSFTLLKKPQCENKWQQQKKD